MLRVLFVCLGNICRSPTAQGVLEKKIIERGLQQSVAVDSAGTADWHVGKAPDARSSAAASLRGYNLSAQRARQVVTDDFNDFDYVLAMDHSNLSDLQAIKPSQARTQPVLFLRAFAKRYSLTDVPDPYYGGAEGFERVLDLIEDACDGLLDDIEQRIMNS